MTMTGISSACLTEGSRLRTSRPPSLGMSRSRSIRCGASCSTFSRAWTPSPASSVLYPDAWRRSSSIVVMSSSSSTIRIFEFIPFSSSPSRRAPSVFHHIDDQTSQRLRIKIRRLVRHPFPGLCHRLHLTDLRGIQEQGACSGAISSPVERFVIVLGVHDGFLLLLTGAEHADDELLKERDVQLCAGRGGGPGTMFRLERESRVPVLSVDREPERRCRAACCPQRVEKLFPHGELRLSREWEFLHIKFPRELRCDRLIRRKRRRRDTMGRQHGQAGIFER